MIRDILTLRRNECKYCVTDDTPFLFCGDPVMAGSSYCEDHHYLCTAGYGMQVGALEKMIYKSDHSVAPRQPQSAAIVPVDEAMRERK